MYCVNFKLCFCLLYVAYFLGLFSFISLFVLLWYERFIAEMCSRDVILELRSVRWELSAQVRSTVERAGCGRTCRGRTSLHRLQRNQRRENPSPVNNLSSS